MRLNLNTPISLLLLMALAPVGCGDDGGGSESEGGSESGSDGSDGPSTDGDPTTGEGTDGGSTDGTGGGSTDGTGGGGTDGTGGGSTDGTGGGSTDGTGGGTETDGEPSLPTLDKTLVKDLIPDLQTPGGLIYEKIEGSAVMPNGDVWIINDNDGVDDNSGETQLMNLGDAIGGGEPPAPPTTTDSNFNRVSSFLVCSQTEADCNTDDETAAEIVAASTDGNTLVYTDSPKNAVGFVDITDPTAPAGLGTLALDGEPTSVGVIGDYALVAINTSEDFVNVSGELVVVDIATQMVVTTLDLGGQPDAVAIAPSGDYAGIAIENERDEDLGDGGLPQLPPGAFIVVDTSDADPTNWFTTSVDLTGAAGMLEPTDPEPEYVDINDNDLAVVTLQENNHILLIDMATASITQSFAAGSTNLTMIDATEEDPAIISLTESQSGRVREPDGVAWINDTTFATADEGDWNGGSRGYTVFSDAGTVQYEAGNTVDHITVRHGHYPDGRSENKGNEPENVEFGTFGGTDMLFVASERSSLVLVYDVTNPASPVFAQALPAAAGPEGVLAIPSRNLVIAASEEDNRGDKLRSVLNIYSYEQAVPQYPTIASGDRGNGTPIPWGAMSGLAAGPSDANTLYAVEDSFYGSNRIFGLDVSSMPATLDEEITIVDTDGVFAAIPAESLSDPAVPPEDPSRIDVFDEADLDALINDDNTVNIDPEGVAVASDGGFWVASEGSGTVGDPDRPINSLNFIFKLDASGKIEQVVTLPDELNATQLRFGFEGITEYDGKAYVAFQRAWGDESEPRIGVYDPTDESWGFFAYPLDAPESQNGGWVGLSDLTALGDGKFLVVERDNQGGPDAAIKRLYTIDVTGLTPGN